MKADKGTLPETHYAQSTGASIAYQVVGNGPFDVIMVPGFPSHLELAWEYPRLAHFYHRLASFCRLILLDKRGLGMSDRVPVSELPGLEQRLDDVRAVMDAVGSQRAALIGVSDGGPLAALFAATYPKRTERLVLVNTYACRLKTEGYPWAPEAQQWEDFQRVMQTEWGKPLFVEILAPSLANDLQFTEWWARFLRQSLSPGAAVALLRMNAEIDIRAVLGAIHVPTLILHRTGDGINPVGGARYMASEIPGAKLIELEGDGHHPWMGDSEAILSEIQGFLAGDRRNLVPEQVLASLLFTDIVGSTDTAARLGDHDWNALLETHDAIVRVEIVRFHGREVNTTGDGFLAMFDGPARAVRCGLSVVEHLAEVGIKIRAGVHTSEVELSGTDIRGLGVHVAARVMSLADPEQVVVSSVVRDLALGSGLTFSELGRYTLKGVPGEWLLFRASHPR